jgi:hypothetical protein
MSSRRSWLPIAASCLLTLLATPVTTRAATPPTPRDLVLRLPDLGPGYEIALDHTCVPLELDSVMPGDSCQLSFRRVWTPIGAPPGPSFVTSVVLTFESPEAAHAALHRPRALVAEMLGVSRESIAVAGPTTALGEEGSLLRFDRRDTEVLWRSGSVVGLVAPGSVDGGDAGEATALRLGAAQQARLATPTPLRRSENDDTEVELDDPHLDIPVFWLGRTLAARGRLPSLRIAGVQREGGDDARAGARATLQYEGHRANVNVNVGLARRSILRRPFARRALRRLHRNPCTRIARFAVPGGRAVIYTRATGCRRAPDNVFALVVRRNVVIVLTVDLFGPPSRYATRAGLRRLVQSLRVRETPAP